MNTSNLIKNLRLSLDESIDLLLPKIDTRPSRLHSAMHYSVKNGGKRIRAILLLLCAESFKKRRDPLPAAVALECVHAYSLIHDDLPALDNSDLRRGKPSCHIKFDQPTAILAGDALLTESFRIISGSYKDDCNLAVRLMDILSKSIGSTGMIAGQQEDIENQNKKIDKDKLEYIHSNKTAKLIQASINMGFSFTPIYDAHLKAIESMGYHLGMAYQYQDDLLDETSTIEKLGKPIKSDKELDKLSSVKVNGIKETRSLIETHTNTALEYLESINIDSKELEAFIKGLGERIN